MPSQRVSAESPGLRTPHGGILTWCYDNKVSQAAGRAFYTEHAAPASNSDKLRVIYVFAGHRRRADIREHLERLAQQFHYVLDMHEFEVFCVERTKTS